MRLLIVSYFFPPYNTIGAVRVGKMAKYFREFGHDVRVVTAKDQPLPATLGLDLPEQDVTYSPWLNVNAPVELALGGRGKIATKGYSIGGGGGGKLKRLGLLYKSLFNFPDGQIGWYPYARAAAEGLARDWRPDLIYASAMPVTSLLVARSVARRLGLPWVAELRDLWVDSHLYAYGRFRRGLEVAWERRILSAASGVVTVSESLAEILRQKYGRPTAAILNGFDPEDYPTTGTAVPSADRGTLRLVYTGTVSNYEGRREPSPLFAALREMGPEGEKIRVAFYGRYLETVRRDAEKYGVAHLVEVHEPVSHTEALRLQATADALLLLLWDDPGERGVYTGKFFEYMGARRPLLVIGPDDNVAARLISERGAGFAGRDPAVIAAGLRAWLAEKGRTGSVAAPPAEAASGLSREDQARRLEEFLLSLGGRR